MVASAKSIIEASLSNDFNITPRVPLSVEVKEETGLWDTFVSTVAPKNEITNKRNFVFLPVSLEKLIGDFSYRSLVASEGGLSFNPEKKMLIEDIKKHLLPHIQRDFFDWDIQLVSSKEINAAALPGGKIIICEGIIDEMVDYLRAHIDQIQPGLSKQSIHQQSLVLGKHLKSMVASVIGHEIAHADIGHTRSSLQRLILVHILLLIGYALTYLFFLGSANQLKENQKEDRQERVNLLQTGARFFYNQFFSIGYKLYNLSQSRHDEYEADEIGMKRYLYQAGYDPQGAVLMLDMLAKKNVTTHTHNGLVLKVEEFFSSHPLSENRKERAEKIRDELKAQQTLKEGRSYLHLPRFMQ